MAIATLFNTAVHRELSRTPTGRPAAAASSPSPAGSSWSASAFTSLGLAVAQWLAPGVLLPELLALTVANLVAAVFRFAVLRAWIFRPSARAPLECPHRLAEPSGTDLRSRGVRDDGPHARPRRPGRRPRSAAARSDARAGHGDPVSPPAGAPARLAAGPAARPRRPLLPGQGERRGLGASRAPAALLVGTAVLYLWDLGASGWANSFYSAAVQAGTKSWKAFFFGSSDSSNFITVDKPPAFLWPMEISARIFGLNSWSILAPQALEGVATVGLVYLSVRRWFSAQAALLGRRGGGADAGGGDDVPLQQPRRHAGPAAHRRHLRHHPRRSRRRRPSGSSWPARWSASASSPR